MVVFVAVVVVAAAPDFVDSGDVVETGALAAPMPSAGVSPKRRMMS